MTPIGSLIDTPAWFALGLVALILLTGLLSALIQAARSGLKGRDLVFSALFLALAAAVFFVLTDALFLKPVRYDPIVMPFERAAFRWPWLIYAGAEAACAAALGIITRRIIAWRWTHPGLDAIREAVDLLPEGLCVCDERGAPLIMNLTMTRLHMALTGALMSDADAFMRHIEETGEAHEGSYLVRTPSGDAWLIARAGLTIEGRSYERLTALDVTERYRVTEALQRNNSRLRDVQRRMKAVSSLSADMFVQREEAAARAALHNQLGQVLLMGRHLLEHPERADAGMVLMMTRQMNAFLLGEAEEPARPGQDPLQDALTIARSIDVAVDISGPLPGDGPIRALLGQAIRECAANAVKHAEGDRLTVELTRGDDVFIARVTNNGRPPRNPINESGGLLTLRRAVEAAGGTMTVDTEPAFALEMHLPTGRA